MIQRLRHNSAAVAEQIHAVFQSAYAIEARLIGCDDFPPLSRSAGNIRASTSTFLGEIADTELRAVIEYSETPGALSIDSLVVHPEHFRQGHAGRLLEAVIEKSGGCDVEVETAVANVPAIALYQREGFRETERWTTGEGIQKLKLLRKA